MQRTLWSHQGLNLGPPDYESGATNQLSYRTIFCLLLVISALDFASSVGRDGYVYVGCSNYKNNGDMYVFTPAGKLHDRFDSAGLNPLKAY